MGGADLADAGVVRRPRARVRLPMFVNAAAPIGWTIHTRERRFVVESAAPLLRLARAHGSPIEYVPGQRESRLTTLYLDTPRGTWSQGLTQVKFRCRHYDDPDAWWFEMKRKVAMVVDKWRRPLTTAELPGLLAGTARWDEVDRLAFGEPLLALFATQYYRTAFEWPGGVRLTFDRDIWFYMVESRPPYPLAERIGGLRSVVVELKAEAEAPGWLMDALRECHIQEFAKSSRALECLRGHA